MFFVSINHEHLEICTAISNVITSERSFPFYPFSNELGVRDIINTLEWAAPIQSDRMRIAVLVGESNLLSLLPGLAKQADIIICNDLNLMLNQHTYFMIECLSHSTTPDEFLSLYLSEQNPTNLELDDGLEQFEMAKSELQETHFLSSLKRFNDCKKALEQLSFVWTRVDLSDPLYVQALVDTLTTNHAVVTFLNITNVHHYCDCNQLTHNTQLLLTGSEVGFVMFSCGFSAYDKDNLKSRLVNTPHLYYQFLNDTIERQNKSTDIIAILPKSIQQISNLSELVEAVNVRIETMANKQTLYPTRFKSLVLGIENYH